MSAATYPIRWPAVACVILLAGCFGGDNAGSPDTGDTPPPAANRPPVISGIPPSQVSVGRQWRFQPILSDPDGDNLAVSGVNLPGWINLDSVTGLAVGTPGEADVRTWQGIELTVSDGLASASLPRFSVAVLAAGAATGTATLSWLPPTERIDGSPIGELAGYRILYGQVSRQYDHTVELNSAGITRYVVEGLTSGTWYFAIQAVTSDGLISEPSAEASKTF